MERLEFLNNLAITHDPQLAVLHEDQCYRIEFEAKKAKICITVPKSTAVLEFFTDVFEGDNKVHSDWLDIYALGNESPEQLERDFQEEIARQIEKIKTDGWEDNAL